MEARQQLAAKSWKTAYLGPIGDWLFTGLFWLIYGPYWLITHRPRLVGKLAYFYIVHHTARQYSFGYVVGWRELRKIKGKHVLVVPAYCTAITNLWFTWLAHHWQANRRGKLYEVNRKELEQMQILFGARRLTLNSLLLYCILLFFWRLEYHTTFVFLLPFPRKYWRAYRFRANREKYPHPPRYKGKKYGRPGA